LDLAETHVIISSIHQYKKATKKDEVAFRCSICNKVEIMTEIASDHVFTELRPQKVMDNQKRFERTITEISFDLTFNKKGFDYEEISENK